GRSLRIRLDVPGTPGSRFPGRLSRLAATVLLTLVLTSCGPVTSDPYMTALNEVKGRLTSSQGIKYSFPPESTCDPRVADFGTKEVLETEVVGGRWYRITSTHKGIDIMGQVIIAPADGKVLAVDRRTDAGYMVTLLHGPEDIGRPNTYAFTFFFHLKE